MADMAWKEVSKMSIPEPDSPSAGGGRRGSVLVEVLPLPQSLSDVSKVAKSLVLLGGSRGAPPIEGGEGDRDRGGSSQKCSEDTLQGWEGSSTTAALVGAAAGEGRWSLSLKGVARRKRRTDPSANPKATSPPSEDTEEALSELEEGGTNTCSRGRDRSVIENTFIV
jgi:hypothetical protein